MSKYSVLIQYDKTDKIYVASIPELPGCMAHGNTREQALKEIEIAKELWIETAIEDGQPVPEPDLLVVQLFFGREVVKIPVSEAQKKATAKYEKENYDKILVRFPKGMKEKIQEKSKSINGFIVEAVKKELEKQIDLTSICFFYNHNYNDIVIQFAQKIIYDSVIYLQNIPT